MSKPVRSRRGRGAGTVRCAIYTRKSHEDGLDQDFNSLHAQREAGEAFILSQKHEGWTALANHYDDGAFSGATLERPALQQLLDDIRSNKVDVVVVYKVDRLTRSLADFAKIVEVFDESDASFVSVTQQFNTTTSMGRLTLNVLLSFAQFEREVTGERIRDKIAASKKKGMWMGGLPPLGYDVRDRKLVVNKAEAKTVRHIFRRYLDLGSVSVLRQVLAAEGVVSKVRTFSDGRDRGGKPIARGALYHMLQNPIYRGQIVHKDKSYPGDHAAIVDAELWARVQAMLATNRVDRRNGTGAKSPSLLTGLLFDDQGHRLTPSHAVKNGRRYRYYVSQPLVTTRRAEAPAGRRVPAHEIESIVTDRIMNMLRDSASVMDAIDLTVTDPVDQKRLLDRAASLANTWDARSAEQRRGFLRAVLLRVDLMAREIVIHLSPTGLIESLQLGSDHGQSDKPSCEQPRSATEVPLTLSVPAQLKRTGMEMRMVVAAPNRLGRKAEPDPGIVRLITKAHLFRDKLLKADRRRLRDVAAAEGISPSYFTRVLRLAFLSPVVTRALLSGDHPPELSALKLERGSRLSIDWAEQGKVLGF